MLKKILYTLLIAGPLMARGQATIIQYLSGTDKDHTTQWDFYCTGGRKSGEWTKIAVPSNWELQGFGSFNYGHDKSKANERGIYRHEFTAGAWQNKKVFIVFDGVMTDASVTINGQPAGPVHQGGFYTFKYDITKLIKHGKKNKLEVTVDKMSADASVNNAERKSDFWVFGGIFRPVFLEIVPDNFIERVAIDARADGSFYADVYTQNADAGSSISAQIKNLKGQNIGKPILIKANNGDKPAQLKGRIANPALWSAEFPNLYVAEISIVNKKGVVHRIKQRFGFRTVELRVNDGFYVNGAKVVMKGSNRHSFWPETGRTLSRAVHLLDIRLMKQMNMNAVRMSHYPPDREFLDLCDSLGLYVLDELTGWQAKYDTVIGRKLVKELVIRDVNHPSIVFWDNGNEGGWNRGLDDEYALYDPQKRVVIHPWEKFNGTDTKHYPDYNYVVNATKNGQEVFFPTEFMHGLYDGGAGAGLDDFWKVMAKHPHAAGGFIWAFIDESVKRDDKQGIFDSDGNHGADGIVGPHREKEASFYTIKEIWSPVYIDSVVLDKNFTGKIPLQNRYAFTNLNQCRFEWKLVQFPAAGDDGTKAMVKATGTVPKFSLKPGDKGVLQLNLPASWQTHDALYLIAYGPDKAEIFTWSWKILAAPKVPAKHPRFVPTINETAAELQVNTGNIVYYFDRSTGYIKQVKKADKVISLSGGPALAGVKTMLTGLVHSNNNGQVIIEADYGGEAKLHVKWIFAPELPTKLEYQYTQKGTFDFIGLTFHYPESKITGMKWLGQGPYRVWKNRLKGQKYGVWQKAKNNAITGETFNYPEFKGYHAGAQWVTIQNTEAPFTIYTADKDFYLQMLKPAREMDALENNNVEPAFPDADIGILHAISPIGTKFQSPSVMGPQGQKNTADGSAISGALWLDFSN